MSQTSKRRALTSIRVSAHRNAASVTKTLPDKSREEKSKKKSTKRKATFAKPTPAEVTDYCTERSNGIDGQHFVDHYESRGWVVGQGRTPMTDWKAAVRTWERNGFRAKQTKPRLPTPEEDATWTPYGRADD